MGSRVSSAVAPSALHDVHTLASASAPPPLTRTTPAIDPRCLVRGSTIPRPFFASAPPAADEPPRSLAAAAVPRLALLFPPLRRRRKPSTAATATTKRTRGRRFFMPSPRCRLRLETAP